MKDKKNEKILVTGGCGFIGSEVVKLLLKKGYQVKVADDLSKPESSVKAGYEFVNVDLTDEVKTKEVFKDVDVCIHLAAKIGAIGYFHKYPATILSENNKICSSVFKSAAEKGIKRIIYISSSMVYESTDKFPSKEEDLTKIPPPISAYGFSKLSGEWYCRAFAEQFQLKYSICRPFNAYGINEVPREEVGYAHVIPDLIRKILKGEYPLKLLGDGEQTRCFTHISDLAAGIVCAMESENAVNEDFNLSSPVETKIIDLAKILWDLCGRKETFKVSFVPGFKYDVKRRIADSSKAKRLLSWEAKVKLEDGLREVVDWLKKKLKDEDIDLKP